MSFPIIGNWLSSYTSIGLLLAWSVTYFIAYTVSVNDQRMTLRDAIVGIAFESLKIYINELRSECLINFLP